MSGPRPEPLLLHVSDPHLGASAGPERADRGRDHWERFVREAAARRPDLVVITGDIVVDDPDDELDHATAFALVGALSAAGIPWAVVPGNHDVGDHAVRAGLPADWHGTLVSPDRVARWESVWGPSWWARPVGEWTVIGVNAQLLGTGFPAEAAQWAWLEATLRDLATTASALGTGPGAVGRTIVMLHESLDPRPEGVPADSWMTVPTEASDRLRAMLAEAGVALVASGHTHRFLDWTTDGLRQATAPSLAGPIPERDDMDQAAGDPTPGWVEMRLRGDGSVGLQRRPIESGG